MGHREALGHCYWVGKCSLRCWSAGAGLGVPEPARRPTPSGPQALGHPGAARSHRRAESGVGAHRLDLAWGHGAWGKGRAPAGPLGRVLGLTAVAGLSVGLVAAVAGSTERPSRGDWTAALR